MENFFAVSSVQASFVLPSVSSKKSVCAAKVGKHVVVFVFSKSGVRVVDSHVVYEDLSPMSSKAAYGVLKDDVVHPNSGMMVHDLQIGLAEASRNDKQDGNLAFVAWVHCLVWSIVVPVCFCCLARLQLSFFSNVYFGVEFSRDRQ